MISSCYGNEDLRVLFKDFQNSLYITCVNMCCTLCLISAYFCDSFSLSPYFPSVLSDAYVSSGQHIPYSAGFATHTANHHQSVTQHVWSDHTLPVTDVYCGMGGVRARVATVSLDQTCKVRTGMDKLTIYTFRAVNPLSPIDVYRRHLDPIHL